MASLQEMKDALVKADQAGDTHGAQILADEIRKMQPAPVGMGQEAVRGFNRGLARFGDLLTSPARVGLQAAGVPVSDAPVEGLMRRAGLVHDPQSAAGATVQTMFAPTGESIVPGGGLLTAGARMGAKAASPLLRMAGAAPARFAGTELAGSMGAGVGSAIGEVEGGERGRVIGGLLGGFAPSAAAGAVRRTMRGSPTRMTQESVIDPASGRVSTADVPDTIPARLAAFERTGVTPSAGQLGGTHAGRYLEAAAAAVPGGNVFAQRFGERQGQQLKSAVDRVVRSISGGDVPSAREAGTAMKRGAKDFGTRMQARTDALYRQLDQKIPPDSPVSASNTAAALDELTTPVPGMEATTGGMVPAQVARMRDNLVADMGASGMVPYNGIKRLRSEIGEMIGQPTMAAEGARKQQLRRIYAALSEDMKAAADAAGPDARKLFDRANTLYGRGQEYMRRELEPAIKRLEDEGVFTALERGNRDGATKLNRMRTALTKQQWNTVTAAIINRMGRATAGRQDAAGDAFSPRTFLTRWAGMSPEARRAVLPSRGHRRAVEDLATVAQRIDEGAQALANPSGTSNKALTGGAILTAVLRPEYIGEIAAASGGSVGALWAMTSQPFVRWLARSTKLPATQIPGHIGRLADVASASPELGPFIESLVSSLGAPGPAPGQQPPQTASPTP